MKYSIEVIKKIRKEMLEEYYGLIELFPKPEGGVDISIGQNQPNNHFLFVDNASVKDSDMSDVLFNIIAEDDEHQFAIRIGTKTQLSPIYDQEIIDIEDFDDQGEPTNLNEIDANIDEITDKVNSYIRNCHFLRVDGYQVEDVYYSYVDIFLEFFLSEKAKRQLKISLLVS